MTKFELLFNIHGHPVTIDAQWLRMLVTVNGKRAGSWVGVSKSWESERESRDRGCTDSDNYNTLGLTTNRNTKKTVMS
jgi:hypothetical protein